MAEDPIRNTGVRAYPPPSSISEAGIATFTGGFYAGDASATHNLVQAISSATAAVSLGEVKALDSGSIVTCALSGATRGDTIIVNTDPLYLLTAANRDITWFASSGSTAGEVSVWGVNSTLTAVTPTASTVIRLTRINWGAYL